MTLQTTALPKATSIRPAFVSTTNACKLCKPLGAAIAFRGIEGCVPFLHGSQGCATYMRRYLISHFREPVDIASSSLGEKHAIYGGGANLKQGLSNVIAKLRPSLIGIASTCLTETIGDDVPRLVREFIQENQGGCGEAIPPLVTVATPSFGGSHMEGFHAAVKAVVEQLVVPGPRDSATGPDLNLLPGFVSPADLRYLKEIIEYFNLVAVLLPDISETLDGPALMDYQKIPAGGTPLAAIRAMGQARATLELGRVLIDQAGAGRILERRFGVPLKSLGLPIGLRETDRLFEVLADLSGRDPS
ncbi:MAG: nitrogenase, partial [Syntrophobacteraceae bacterium CG07_land_8_20_14_0_80_61_8]